MSLPSDAVSPGRIRNMAAIRSTDTKPERVVRRALHAEGLRFRLHRRDLPGKPDIVLPKYKTVIFVHGCFWHHHGCQYFAWPKTRSEFWREKIMGNEKRDRIAQRALREAGWRVIVVWECETKDAKAQQLAALIVGASVTRKDARWF